MRRRIWLVWFLVLWMMAGCGQARSVEPSFLEQGRAAEAAGWPGDAIDAYRRGLKARPDDAELKAALERVTAGLADRVKQALARFPEERSPESFKALIPLLDAYLRLPESRDLAGSPPGGPLTVLLTPADGVRVVSLYGGPMVEPKQAHAFWIQWFDSPTEVHAQAVERPGAFGALNAALPDGPGSRAVLIKSQTGEHPYTLALALWRQDPATGVWKAASAFGTMPEVVALGRIYSSPERLWVEQYGERAGWLEIELDGRRIAIRGDGIIPVEYADWNGKRYEWVRK